MAAHTNENSDTAPEDTAVGDTAPPTGDVACTPALAVSPEHPSVNIWRSVSLHASGGTGSHHFELLSSDEALSGAEVDPRTGRLFAGGAAGQRLTVRLTDDGCAGESTTTVDVLDAFSPMPLEGRISDGVQFTFVADNLVGDLGCELTQAGSGAVLSGCNYTSGSSEGLDQVRLTDLATGETLTAALTVEPGVTLGLHGEIWMLPLGSQLTLRAETGTGHFTVSDPAGDIVEVAADDGMVRAVGHGSTQLTVSDRFTGQSAVVRVVVAAPVTVSEPRDGEDDPPVVSLGGADWDDDGFEDVVIASTGARLSGAHSGGVYLFSGADFTEDAAPSWTWDTTAGTDAELGSSLAKGDADGDGVMDLLVGSEDANSGGYRNGSVALFLGGAGGLAAVPDQLITGETNYDYLGESIGLCDLDGDGYEDLVAGAPGFDVSTEDGSLSAGALVVLPGSAGGFDEFSRMERTGVQLEDGVWVDSDVDLGSAMATQDFDGDGHCDVAAGSPLVDSGVIFLYRGDSEAMLEFVPRAQVDHDPDDNDYFGEVLLGVGDYLAVGTQRYDAPEGNAGWVTFLDAAALLEEGGRYDVDDIVSIEITARTNQGLGAALDWGTLGGEEGLLLGAPSPKWRDDPGELWWVPSDMLATGALEDMATLLASGQKDSEDRLGTTAVLSGDQAVSFAANDNTYGLSVGAPWVVNAAGDTVRLSYPGHASEHFIGISLASTDLDQDGHADLILGVPGASSETWGLDSGSLWVCYGSAGARCADAPERLLLDWRPSDSRESFLGRQVALGDLTGDGRDELLVLATHEDQPPDFEDYVSTSGTGCGEDETDAGAVLVFDVTDLATPLGVVHGMLADGEPDRMISGFDFNGDGYDDVAFGGEEYGSQDSGAVSIALGGPLLQPGPHARCPDLTVLSTELDEAFGHALVSPGDLDGDGCDELAVTSADADMGESNQGALRILWGAGTACASRSAAVSNFWPARDDNINFGLGMAAPGDLDDDGIPDLVVNADGDHESNYQGILWMIPGWLLNSAPRQSISDMQSVPDEVELVPVDFSALGVGHVWTSTTLGEPLNGQLSSVQDWSDPSRQLIVLERANGLSGSDHGGAWVIDFDATSASWLRVPRAVLAGEQDSPGLLGSTLSGVPGGLLVGAPRSDVSAPDSGAAYVFSLEAP